MAYLFLDRVSFTRMAKLTYRAAAYIKDTDCFNRRCDPCAMSTPTVMSRKV